MDLLEQPRSAWALMEIDGGKSGRSERLVEVSRGLPEAIRTRIALENDEYAYGAEEILEVCRAARVPMVFDAHHHVVHEKLESYEHPSIARYLAAARETWPVPNGNWSTSPTAGSPSATAITATSSKTCPRPFAKRPGLKSKPNRKR